jgi:TRAP-type C4-dicarboxylate transport system permease small subunit
MKKKHRKTSENKHESHVTNPESSTFKSLIQILHRIENAVLVGLLLLMIGMASAQIFLRNVFESGVVWGDVLLRILVLWIGLAGAMIASRDGRHINIDVITRYLPEHLKIIVMCIVELFTAGLCSLLAYHSIRFVQAEFEFGGKAFAQIPVWLCQSIIPFAFIVIAIRYLILALSRIRAPERIKKG